MLILGITTSSARSGIALSRGGIIIAEEYFPGARTCAEELVPRIGKILAAAGLSLKEIDLIATDIGPGGMTGLKIGIVTAKTLAQTAGIPVAGVSSMRILCEGARADAGDKRLMLPVLKCMKGEYFTAIYRAAGDAVECISDERLETENDLKNRLTEEAGDDAGVYVLGDAAEITSGAVREILGARAVFAAGDLNLPSAAVLCRLAASASKMDFRELMPNYLCITHAERNAGVRV